MSKNQNKTDTQSGVRLTVHASVLEHEQRFENAPRSVVVAELHRPVYYALRDHGQCLATALRKYRHELNDSMYFAVGALFLNTVQLVCALVAPAHWLAATCLVAYVWYVLALVPFCVHWVAPSAHTLSMHWLLPMLRWSGLMLTITLVSLAAVWSATSAGVGWRWRVAFAVLQLVTCVLQVNVVVALVNLEDAYYGWLSAYGAMQNMQHAASTPAQRERMTDVGRRVAEVPRSSSLQTQTQTSRRRTVAAAASPPPILHV